MLELNIMENFSDKLIYANYNLFFSLGNFVQENPSWELTTIWFAKFGIVLAISALIYLIVRNRINTLFAATVSCLFSAIIGMIIYLMWQPTYSSDSAIIYGYGNTNFFPPAQAFLAFAIATAVALFGHKKLSAAVFIIAFAIGISRIAIGFNYPLSIIVAMIIGVVSGALAYWFMEHFEDFWANNSAKD